MMRRRSNQPTDDEYARADAYARIVRPTGRDAEFAQQPGYQYKMLHDIPMDDAEEILNNWGAAGWDAILVARDTGPLGYGTGTLFAILKRKHEVIEIARHSIPKLDRQPERDPADYDTGTWR